MAVRICRRQAAGSTHASCRTRTCKRFSRRWIRTETAGDAASCVCFGRLACLHLLVWRLPTWVLRPARASNYCRCSPNSAIALTQKVCLEADLRELLLPASITHAEFIVGLKRNPHIAEKLGMPAHVRQEDGTRRQYQLSFGTVTSSSWRALCFRVRACTLDTLARTDAPHPTLHAMPSSALRRCLRRPTITFQPSLSFIQSMRVIGRLFRGSCPDQQSGSSRMRRARARGATSDAPI